MGITGEEISAVHVAYGQGIAVMTIAHLEVSFVVGCPDIVRLLCCSCGASGMFSSEVSFIACYESFPFQDIGGCGYCRQIGIPGSKYGKEFLGSPGGMLHAYLHDGLNDRDVRFMGAGTGSRY